jgi:predicted membrane-bound spermidine synthase
LAAAVGVLALYAAALPPLFQWLQRSGAGEAAVTAHLVFPLLTVIVGLLVGFLFPLAVHAYKTGETGIGKKSGVLYGMDLLGSCIGALGAGALLIPVLGLLDTCYAVAGVCIVGAGLFVLSERAE